MIFYKFFTGESEYQRFGTRKRYVRKIFSFDIETTSYYKENGVIFPQSSYDPQKYNKKDKKKYTVTYHSCMYIWMLGIDDTVYYGRTWEQLREFFELLDAAYPEKKIIFIHNLTFEFQFMRSEFAIDKVFARSQRKPIYCTLADYNIELRCTYYMSNNALKDLPKMYGLPVEKLSGDLDYSKIRTPITPMTSEEYHYCEHDILVIYHYIRKLLEDYPNVNKIPKTNTGQVRQELQEITRKDYRYKKQVRMMINTDPHVYNLLLEAFAGGYTHANSFNAGLVLENLDSWDEASAYPAMICLFKYPGTEFRKCDVRHPDDLIKQFAYLLRVKFTGLKKKIENSIISYSHCRDIDQGVYDNGRVISAAELEIVCTDIDLDIFLRSYNYESVEILESYYSIYKYLPRTYVQFVLDKYKKKTTLKGIPEYELEYSKEKNRFNSIYGMTVTSTIRAEVEYKDRVWTQRDLTNEEIEKKLWADKKKAFLSFSTGVWVTAWARKMLLDNVIALDEYTAYMDTDSMKLLPGYDKNIILQHNRMIEKRTREVCKKLGYKYSDFAPKDIKGKEHPMGLFEYEETYEQFKTLGAKKYCYLSSDGKIHITVSGVPKAGAACMSKIKDFRKGLIFRSSVTGKNNLFYNDDQSPETLTDYTGRKYTVRDRTGACILPADYTLGVTEEYEELFGSERSWYKE